MSHIFVLHDQFDLRDLVRHDWNSLRARPNSHEGKQSRRKDVIFSCSNQIPCEIKWDFAGAFGEAQTVDYNGARLAHHCDNFTFYKRFASSNINIMATIWVNQSMS